MSKSNKSVFSKFTIYLLIIFHSLIEGVEHGLEAVRKNKKKQKKKKMKIGEEE